MNTRRFETRVAILILCASALVHATNAVEPAPTEVVKAFNEALTHRDLPAALLLFAPGAVKLTLHAAHAGMQTTPGGSITSDLKAHWSQVGSLLFTVTTGYKRAATIIDSRVDGELATVWATISSETVERDGKAQPEQFVELYLLVHKPEGWKIAASADNRNTDKIAVTGNK
jgi:ketosteroid isomerase-like protein